MSHLNMWGTLWAFAGLAAVVFDWPDHIFVIGSQIARIRAIIEGKP